MPDIQSLLTLHSSNTTALKHLIAPPWADAPSYRGTSQILWSSILTLVACVYTALHLNIPRPGATGSWAVLRRKCLWVLTALLAPEIVLYVASMQFLRAWWLQKELKKLFLPTTTATAAAAAAAAAAPPEKDAAAAMPDAAAASMSLRYCFFVVMGGLRVDISDLLDEEEEPNLPPELKGGMAILSSEGVIQLARLGHFVPVSEATINDRSKASFFQKILVLGQVFWMALQCIIRKSQGYPLALIEIHVLVHVVCAAVMYACWFKKPLDVLESELIDSGPWKSVLMLMVQLEIGPKPVIIYPSIDDPALAHQPPLIAQTISKDTGLAVDLVDPDTGRYIQLSWVDLPSTGGHLEVGEALPCGAGLATEGLFLGPRRLQRLKGITSLFDALEAGGHRRTGSLTSLCAGQYYHRAFAQPGSNLALGSDLDDMREFLSKYSLFSSSTRYSSISSSESSSHSKNLSETSGRVKVLVFAWLLLLPVLYGGVHLTAWSFSFPTEAEETLWRMSCIVVISGIFVALVILFIAVLVFGFLDLFLVALDDWESAVFSVIGSVFIGTVCVIGGAGLILYVFARVFIVLESFLSLRATPIGAYMTVAWLQMLPHF